MPQVPDVPEVPIDVPHVPYVPHVPTPTQFVWQIRITLYTRHLDRFPQFVWHVHVLPMFTFREQYELVNKKYVLQTAL